MLLLLLFGGLVVKTFSHFIAVGRLRIVAIVLFRSALMLFNSVN